MTTIHDDYLEAVNGLEEYGIKLCGLINELLLDKNIHVHSITHRVKTESSVTKKLSIKEQKYSKVTEITDLLGVRIITYFPKDVDIVAEIVNKEFKIDLVHSEDKRKILDPDRFGYLSLHFQASLIQRREKLVEYKRFANTEFELQIRSILQHAWAEIEHDLGYKAEGTLPTVFQRRFSRLAGLLEIADDEFENLRVSIDEYEHQIIDVIKRAPQTLALDQSTIYAALTNEKVLIDIDKAIANEVKSLLSSKVSHSYTAGLVRDLREVGVSDIYQLTKIAEEYKKHIICFVKYWNKREDALPFNKTIMRGISLFYLSYVLAAQLDDKQLTNWGLSIKGRNDNLLNNVKQTWQKVVKDLGKPPKATIN